MAILRMKKLKCAVVRSEKKVFLKDLVKLGCVQIDEMDTEGEALGRETTELIALRTTHAAMLSAISLLNDAKPEKGGILSAKPEFSKDELLSDEGLSGAIEAAESIVDADESIRRFRTEESRARADIEALRPWLELDLPLDFAGTKYTDFTLGTVPSRLALNDAQAAMSGAAPESELFLVSEDKGQKYIVIVSYKDQTDAACESLRPLGFNVVSFSDISVNARQRSQELMDFLSKASEEKEQKKQFIASQADKRDSIKLGADKLQTRIVMAQATEKLAASEKVIFFEGWVPAEREAELDALVARYDAAYETSDPTEDEYPSVPVSLKNNKLTNSLNMVTNMYSLPQYGTVDPNPWMAPFFILFYGLMMADMGYGIIMIAAGIVALRKIKPRGNSLAFCQLLLYSGIATFICGAMTGGFFSDIIYQLVHIFNPESTWEGLPYLFSPVRDSETVLYGSLALGAVHLNVGMVCSFIQKVKKGDTAGAIWEEGALWVLLVTGILTYFGVGVVGGVPVLLIAGILMLLFGAGRQAKGFKKVTAAFGCIYNTATGWFGDILSYSRIMALMLAGGVVGQVFNTVAVMPMKNSGANVLTIIAFIIIFLLGHIMNFGLNLLGCYVHDLRLQCLEYFGKFYTDGGKPFTPLDINSKYVNPKNN